MTDISTAARDVLAERQRQISDEGWTAEHDDDHDKGELAMAAACYALVSACSRMTRENLDYLEASIVGRFWPFRRSWWKRTDRRRDLVKAGALILAEIERIDRAAAGEPCGECHLQAGETCDICGRKVGAGE